MPMKTFDEDCPWCWHPLTLTEDCVVCSTTGCGYSWNLAEPDLDESNLTKKDVYDAPDVDEIEALEWTRTL